MASPQPEPFVQFSKELYRAILLAPFGVAQQTIVLAVVLKTYGDYGRKSAPISVGLLARLTGQNKGHVSRSLASLVKEGVIHRISAGQDDHTAQVLALNKDYECWGRFSVPVETVALKATVDEEQPLPSGNGTVTTMATHPLPPWQRNGCSGATTEDIETRDIEKHSLSETAAAASSGDNDKAPEKPPTVRKKTPAEWQAEYDQLMEACHFPSDVLQLAELMAEGNKTGQVAVSRVVRELLRPIVGMQDEFSDAALRHGLRAAITRPAPNANYVRKAAAGHQQRPAAASIGARATTGVTDPDWQAQLEEAYSDA